MLVRHMMKLGRQPWDQSTLPDNLLTGADFCAAAIGFMFSMAVAGALAWFALPLMCQRSWSLIQKFGATWAGFVLLRLLSP